VEVEVVARAMLSVVDRRIEPGQIECVLDAMPERVPRFWRDVQQDEDIQ
jgi:uncharacterized protein (DUF2267 family)